MVQYNAKLSIKLVKVDILSIILATQSKNSIEEDISHSDYSPVWLQGSLSTRSSHCLVDNETMKYIFDSLNTIMITPLIKPSRVLPKNIIIVVKNTS